MGKFRLVTFERSVYRWINADFRNIFSITPLRSLRAPRLIIRARPPPRLEVGKSKAELRQTVRDEAVQPEVKGGNRRPVIRRLEKLTVR